MVANFCVSSGNVGLCVKDFQRKDKREGNRRRLFSQATSSLPTKPGVSFPLSLKGSGVLLFQASIHSRRDLKDNEMQLFHCTDGETMSLRAFIKVTEVPDRSRNI